MDFEKWKNALRELNTKHSTVLSHRNGHWKVLNKFSLLSNYALFFYDSHLDSIKTLALTVLAEIHPALDLEPHDRFAAAIYGKIPKYSSELRKGICETLAFLGIHGAELKNCTQHKPENTAAIAIRELFKEADWKLWASLNEILPILAEASPNEFLAVVENAFKQTSCPFDELFSQEGKGGITGANYMTGIYWALETLAWSEEYLARAILILAELAARDPGGTYGNRPANSISTILLPWMPQTTADVDKRIAALQGIKRHFPAIAWKTVIALLPRGHQTSMGSRKPLFRNFIPEDWKNEVNARDYWGQVQACAELALDMAKGNISYISELVDNLDNIPQPPFNFVLEYLSSDDICKLPDEQKQPIWDTMLAFVRKHRHFSNAKWALPAETVDLLQRTADKIAPSTPFYLYIHLFSNRDFNFNDKEVDWNTQQSKIKQSRINAIKQIFEINKTDSVVSFAEKVESAEKVGVAFAHIANDEHDQIFLPSFLDSQVQSKKLFATGYIRSRYHLVGPDWLNGLNIETWPTELQCEFLFNLPFEIEIWEKAEKLLGKEVKNYWGRVNANPFATQSTLLPAIESLINYDRPILALDCISAHSHLKKEFLREQAIKALSGTSSNETLHSMDVHNVTEIIKKLQDDPQVHEDDLFKIEWRYLPLLKEDFNAKPKVLEKRLSQNPSLFIKAVQLIYRSTNSTSEIVEDESQKNMASNAFKLLHYWKRPPGKQDDGSFSGEALLKWFEEAKQKSIESGHYEVAMTHLGRVLYYGGSDPDGLWIHQSIAELLDKKENDHIRRGFSSEIYNSRGVHAIDPSGTEERILADSWRRRADEIEKLGFIHFASSLKELANSYDREAERVAYHFSKGQDENNSDGIR